LDYLELVVVQNGEKAECGGWLTDLLTHKVSFGRFEWVNYEKF